MCIFLQNSRSFSCFTPFLQVTLHGQSRSKERKKLTQRYTGIWFYFLFSDKVKVSLLIPTDRMSKHLLLVLLQEGYLLKLNSLQVSEEITPSLIIKPSKPELGWYFCYETVWGIWPNLAVPLISEKKQGFSPAFLYLPRGQEKGWAWWYLKAKNTLELKSGNIVLLVLPPA